jgi:cell wall-associated NlpC family hydrolase
MIVGVKVHFLLALGGFAVLSGCSSGNDRMLPRDGLLARAWDDREPKATERGLEVVAFAAAQLGRPYCWGGTGPRCFDCSGLAQAAWRRAGMRIPRTTDAIAASLAEVPFEDVRAGDILWWPGHVGIYASNGWVIDALDSRHGVVVRPAKDPYRAFRPAAELLVQATLDPRSFWYPRK